MTDPQTKDEIVARVIGGNRRIIYPGLLALSVAGLWLVSRASLEHGQDDLAKWLFLAPFVVAGVVLFALSPWPTPREPPVFLPFTGAAPAALPPVEALGPHAATLVALIQRAAALRQEQWDDVLRPMRRVIAPRRSEAARRALARAEAALGTGAQVEGARAALAAHIRAAFSADGATPEMIAPSFVYAAGLGLMACGSLSADELRALYGPFEGVIPLRSLPAQSSLASGDKTRRIVAAHERSVTDFGEVYRDLAD
jgi:hypothetical protein